MNFNNNIIIPIKGDASFRKFYRKKNKKTSSIIIYSQKENKLKLTEVTSPTFNLLNEYKINEIKINHYDLFRLKSVEEIKNLGLFDDITNLITLIEWPELINEKPTNRIDLFFKYKKDYNERSLVIKTNGRLKVHEF